ncbi:MAG: GHKL domain-containing protein [Treponema sp.]|jgi:sensor histidine kinase regulating citrate/malate metabolism|nr:GHKL domain-containing protein [Treponema sp.]
MIELDADLTVVDSLLKSGNVMEACALLSEHDRFIRVYIDVKRGHLYISVTNSSKGRAAKQNGRYVSAKGGFHGLGLLRVDRLVDKYGGYVKRRDEEGVFTSEIMLPCSARSELAVHARI